MVSKSVVIQTKKGFYSRVLFPFLDLDIGLVVFGM
jgi:hypothetical protein